MQATSIRHWQYDGFRWLAKLAATLLHNVARGVVAIAEAIERRLDRPAEISSHEMHFDSDIYLAEIRNRVHLQYYY